MKKQSIGKISILFIFIFIGITTILSITLYNVNQDTIEREENILQLNMELNDLKIKNNQLLNQLDKKYTEENKIIDQINQDINQLKKDKVKLNFELQEYEKHIELLTKKAEQIQSDLEYSKSE